MKMKKYVLLFLVQVVCYLSISRYHDHILSVMFLVTRSLQQQLLDVGDVPAQDCFPTDVHASVHIWSILLTNVTSRKGFWELLPTLPVRSVARSFSRPLHTTACVSMRSVVNEWLIKIKGVSPFCFLFPKTSPTGKMVEKSSRQTCRPLLLCHRNLRKYPFYI